MTGPVLPSNDNSPRPVTVMEAHGAVNCPDRDKCWAAEIHDKFYPRPLAGRSNDEPTDDHWELIQQVEGQIGPDGLPGQEASVDDVNRILRGYVDATERLHGENAELRARLEAVTTERDRLNSGQCVDELIERIKRAEAETLRLRAQLDQIRDACGRAEAEGQDDAIERGVAVHVYSDVSTSALRRIIGADSTPGSVTTTGRCDYRGADGAACDRPNGHADHADAQGHPVPWGIYTEPNRCRWCGGENPLHRTDESGAAVLGGTADPTLEQIAVATEIAKS